MGLGMAKQSSGNLLGNQLARNTGSVIDRARSRGGTESRSGIGGGRGSAYQNNAMLPNSRMGPGYRESGVSLFDVVHGTS